MEKERALHIKFMAVIALVLFASGVYFYMKEEAAYTAPTPTSEAEEILSLQKQAAEAESHAVENKTNVSTVAAPAGPTTEEEEKKLIKNQMDQAALQISNQFPDVKVIKDIEYAKPRGDSMKLDIYLPNQTGDVPALIWIHGGGLMEGSKDDCPGRTFASNGYATVCIDYRLAKLPGYGCPDKYLFPAQIHDVKAAVRWMRKNGGNYSIDTDRIGAIGASSGGHMAALLGVSRGDKYLEGTDNLGYDDSVSAVVDYYGPIDTINGPIVFKEDVCSLNVQQLSDKTGGEEVPYFYLTMSWSSALGGSLGNSTILEKAKKATPLTYIDPTDPPYLIIHGKNDGMVPLNQSRMLADALKNAGVEATLLELDEMGHGISNLPGVKGEVLPKVLKPTLDFLDKHLKGG